MKTKKTVTASLLDKRQRGLDLALVATKTDLAGMARQSDFAEMKGSVETLLRGIFSTLQEQMDELRREVQRLGGIVPEFYTCEQLQQLISGAYSVRTLQKMCADGRLPAVKKGISWLIPVEAVEAWKEEFYTGDDDWFQP